MKMFFNCSYKLIYIENKFHIEIGINFFFKCFWFGLNGYCFCHKVVPQGSTLEFQGLISRMHSFNWGNHRQLFWTLFNDARVEVWTSELQLKKVRRSWGIRLLQYSYASFSWCNLITSWTLSIFRSMNKGLAWLSKSENVMILTHFFWSFTILK